MNCARYIEKFGDKRNLVEETFSFEIKKSDKNPRFADEEAEKLESELEKYADEYIGLDFSRNKLIFQIRIVANDSREGHLDKFHRIQSLFLDHSSYTPLRQIED